MNTRTHRPIPLALTALIALFSALAALAVSGGHDAHAHGTTPAYMVAAAPITTPAPFEFTGDGAEYFRIWVINLLLTLATLADVARRNDRDAGRPRRRRRG